MKQIHTRLIMFALTLVLSACAGATANSDPVAVLKSYESAWNAEDLEAVMALIAENAVETNGRGTFTGKEAIRGVYEDAINDFRMACNNYRVNGIKVTYDCILTLTMPGQVQVGERYEAVIEGGLIKSAVRTDTFTP